KKVKPRSGQSISNIVNNARPLRSSPTSLVISGRREARRIVITSGERKKYILQSGRRLVDGRAKIIKRTDAAYASVREQNETITDAFSVGELMNCNGERSALRSDPAHKGHNFSRLPDVEAVKRLVHQQHRMWGQQCQCQHQPTGVSLRQCGHTLSKNFFKAN